MTNLFEMNEEGLGFFGLDGKDFSKEKLIIITGDNASGKSLLRRVIYGNVKKNNMICAALSHEKRVTADLTRAFVYGNEGDESTGSITAKSIIGLFRSSKEWGVEHVIMIDEPEIGLSEESQKGLGEYIIEKMKNTNDKLKNVIIFTHSRILLSELEKLTHHYFHIGNKYNSIHEFNTREILATSPTMLLDIADANYIILSKILKKG